MQTMQYMLLQDRLSTKGSFILCDVQANGFPIRYASQGFLDLFKHSAKACQGVKCGALVGAPAILKTPKSMELCSAASDQNPEELESKFDVFTSYGAEECRLMMKTPETKIGFFLALNCTKGGEVIVCEIIMLVHEHPHFGWSYSLGIQTDVTSEISVAQLLSACTSRERYVELVTGREAKLSQKVLALGLKDSNTEEYLKEKAEEMWQALMFDAFPSKPTKNPLATLSSTTLSTSVGESGEGSLDDDASSIWEDSSTRRGTSTCRRTVTSAGETASTAEELDSTDACVGEKKVKLALDGISDIDQVHVQSAAEVWGSVRAFAPVAVTGMAVLMLLLHQRRCRF